MRNFNWREDSSNAKGDALPAQPHPSPGACPAWRAGHRPTRSRCRRGSFACDALEDDDEALNSIAASSIMRDLPPLDAPLTYAPRNCIGQPRAICRRTLWLWLGLKWNPEDNFKCSRLLTVCCSNVTCSGPFQLRAKWSAGAGRWVVLRNKDAWHYYYRRNDASVPGRLFQPHATKARPDDRLA